MNPVSRETETMADYRYFTNCTERRVRASSLIDMQDRAIEITWRTLTKHVSRKEIDDIFGELYPPLKDDYAVSFHRSKLNDKRCYYINHSAIEYIFIQHQ